MEEVEIKFKKLNLFIFYAIRDKFINFVIRIS